MTTQHTQGRLYVVESQEHWGRVNCHLTAEVDDASIGSIWVNGTSKNRANARRLVACWNACEGIPTEMLEAVCKVPLAAAMLVEQLDHFKALAKDNGQAIIKTACELADAKAQRDDLLEALKDATTSLETISLLSGRKTFGQPPIETYMEDFMQVRGYANSRMTVARAAIAKVEGVKE